MFKNKAFSLIEILLVVGIAAGIFALSAPFALKFYHTQLVEDTRSNVIDALQRARHNAILQKNDSSFGVHFMEGSYVLYQGNSYVTRDETQDEVFPVLSEITFDGPGDIIFSKLTGAPNSGTIAVAYGNISRGIYVEASGVISKIDTVDGVEIITETYTITFDANGGSGSMSSQTIDSGDTASLNTNTFTKSSYVFAGWATTAGGAVAYVNGASYTIGSANVTLYAQWITTPGAPTIGTATAGDTTASITFSAPASDGGSAITGYTVTASSGGHTGTGSGSPISVSGLTNGTAYTFTVTATNAAGTGPASAASNSVTPSAIPTGGLVSYWPFTGNANDVIATNHGTAYGNTSLTTGVKGLASTAYTFDGNGDYIRIPNFFSQNRDSVFSVSVWAKFNVLVSGTGSLVGQRDYPAGYNQFGWLMAQSASGVSFSACKETVVCYGVTSPIANFTTGVFYHLVGVYDNLNMKLYVNGVLIGSDTFLTTGTGTSTKDVMIGGTLDWSNPAYYSNSVIDELRFYNRALTAGEIASIYTEERLITVPDAPTIGTATAGNATSSVAFTAPNSNGGSTITSYTVTSSPGGFTATGSASPIIVTGLTNGTAYTFTVTATNAMGTGSASAASNAVTPTAVPGGLVSFWPFTGNANDVVGPNNGTVTGATLTAGVKGEASTAYVFDGNDYVGTSYAGITAGNARSASIWFKTTDSDAPTAYQNHLISWGTDTTAGKAFQIATNDNYGTATNYNGLSVDTNTGAITYTAANIYDGEWHHVVVTAASNATVANILVYLDGTLLTNVNHSANTSTVLNTATGGVVQIGALAGARFFTGSIDQARIYNRAISADEVTSIYNEERLLTVPGAPTIGTATAGNGSASVAFTAPTSNGGSTITSYTVTSNPGSFTSTDTTSPITVSGLTNGTAYTFTVTATNAIGTSSASEASNSVSPTGVPSSGLVSHWPFTGNANDVVGSNNGTVVNAVLGTGVNGEASTAYSFDGNGDYINLGLPASLDVSISSFSAWVNFTVLPGDQTSVIYGEGLSSSAGNPYAMLVVSNNKFGYWPSTGSYTTTGSTLLASTWYHVVYNRVNSTTLDVYVDGVFKGTLDGTTWFNNTAGDNYAIGAMRRSSLFGSINGLIDNVRIYNRALTTDEITNIYNEEKPDPTVPGAPTIGTATAGNATSSVTFTAPASDGGSTITSYTVTSSPGGLTGTGSASPITVTGLTNGTAYTFTVTATNAIGTGSASAASNSVMPDVVASGLVSYWPFTGNANDAVGSNNGTVTGATLTTGVKGVASTAYAYDGNDYVSAGNVFNLAHTDNFTIGSWVYNTQTLPTSGFNGRTIVSKTKAGEWTNGYFFMYGYYLDSYYPGYYIDFGFASHREAIANYQILPNQWYYLSVVFDSATQNAVIYVNGVAQATSMYSSGSALNSYNFRIGSWFNDDARSHVGRIDQTRIYNRVLSANEILTIYNEEKPTIPGAPTIGTATAGNATSSVTFTAPASDGGSAITSYTVTSSPGSLTGTGSASPITVTGLTNGTAYTFTVTATNAIGTSSASSASNSIIPSANCLATGGTITTSDGYIIHTFTSSGTFTVTNACSVEVLVVAGGGGGGGGGAPGGGGGAGGLTYNTAFDLTAGAKTVTIGNGGSEGDNGQNSVFSTITSTGGGRGASYRTSVAAAIGGSGGGGGYYNGTGAAGTSGQGSAGGNAKGTAEAGATKYEPGGGGGAGAVGANWSASQAGAGGAGLQYSQFASVGGSPAGWFAGGGGGTATHQGTVYGVGGNGGGGDGDSTHSTVGVSGTANTGGGGGSSHEGTGGAGGSGIVIVRYSSTTAIPASGLVSYWPFTGNANDAVGTNNATVNGATLTTGVKGVANTAYGFDGNDYLSVLGKTLIANDSYYTVSVWVKTNTLSGLHQVFDTGQVPATGYSVLMRQTGSDWMANHNTSSGDPEVRYTGGVVSGQWTHLALTWNGSNIILYAQGSSRATTTATSHARESTYNYIGAEGTDYASPSEFFSGSIDELRIYSRALSAQEITDIYNEEKP